jgi:hypothetical protein
METLPCGLEPAAIGAENPDGTADPRAVQLHNLNCTPCRIASLMAWEAYDQGQLAGRLDFERDLGLAVDHFLAKKITFGELRKIRQRQSGADLLSEAVGDKFCPNQAEAGVTLRNEEIKARLNSLLAVDIVEKLAASAPRVDTEEGCYFCGALFKEDGDTIDPGEPNDHEPHCLWRRANKLKLERGQRP